MMEDDETAPITIGDMAIDPRAEPTQTTPPHVEVPEHLRHDRVPVTARALQVFTTVIVTTSDGIPTIFRNMPAEMVDEWVSDEIVTFPRESPQVWIPFSTITRIAGQLA